MPIWLNIITLFVIGFILLFIEVAIIPGFGLPGILGIMALIAAGYTAFTSLSPLIGVVVCLISIVLFITLFKLLPKSGFWKKTMLSHSEGKSQGYHVGSDDTAQLKNKTGITLTMLRPSGTIIIDDKHYDAISDCEFIEKNKNIIVLNVDDNKIVVQEIKQKT
ncbi:MAG: NfeD family protein [Candidatus Omnitrophota bacterium]